jgi:hypothetical protein
VRTLTSLKLIAGLSFKNLSIANGTLANNSETY